MFNSNPVLTLTLTLVESIEELANLFHILSEMNPSHLHICVDFNIPLIDWALHICLARGTHIAIKFLGTIDERSLPSCTAMRRLRESEVSNTLDLIMTSEERMVAVLNYQLVWAGWTTSCWDLDWHAMHVRFLNHVRLIFHKADVYHLKAKIEVY